MTGRGEKRVIGKVRRDKGPRYGGNIIKEREVGERIGPAEKKRKGKGKERKREEEKRERERERRRRSQGRCELGRWTMTLL